MSPPPASPHRFNQTILAQQERKILMVLAPRLPGWMSPDALTWTGILGAGIVTLGGILSNSDIHWLWLANVGLCIHWFGDSLDGTVARLRNIERPRYGFYFDQVIDTVGNLLITLGVGLCPMMRIDLALLVLAAYQMLAIQVLVRAIVDREFHMAVGGMGPTELRIGIFAINIAIMLFGGLRIPGLPAWLHWEDVVMTLTFVGLLGLFAMQMHAHMTRLAQEDPSPRS